MQTKIKIDGMHCGACKKRLEDLFNRNDLIKSVEVSVEDGLACIESENNLDLDSIREDIEDMGFEFKGKA